MQKYVYESLLVNRLLGPKGRGTADRRGLKYHGAISYDMEWLISSGWSPLERALPSEFMICCLLVIVASILGQDLFQSFTLVVKTGCNSEG
jgi:hypothetical protein